jgi:hypothetical protein
MGGASNRVYGGWQATLMSMSVVRRRRISPGWIVLAAAVAIVLASVLLLGPFRSNAAPTSQTPNQLHLDATLQPARACSVAGDLVGDANPADVARALCGDR